MKYLVIILILLGLVISVSAKDFQPLIDTIEYSDFDEFKKLMSTEFSINDRDEWGFQPLHYAVGWDWNEGIPYIRHLIKLGTKIDTTIKKKDGQEKDEYYEFEGLTPFLLAARAGNIEAAKFFIEEKKVDINYTVQYTNALDLAVREGGLDMVKYLFPRMKNKEGVGSMPYLNMAINHNKHDTAKFLIESGVDIKSKLDDFTALHHAVFGHSYDPEIMKMLVDRKADVNDTNRWSDTPLHYAAWENPNAVAYLIKNGAKLNPINYDGNTPLLETVIRGNIYAAQILVNAGADLTIKNGEGKTALQIAKENDDTVMIDILTGKKDIGRIGYSLDQEISSGIPLKSVNNGDLKLKKLNGGYENLSDYRGKVVFLNIWATWCPPCRYEMPEMETLYNKLKSKGFEILAVSVDESAQTAKDYIKENKYTFKVYHDPLEETMQDTSYSSNGYPTTYIIDRNGLTIHESSGSRNWSEDTYVEFISAFLTDSNERRTDNKKNDNKKEDNKKDSDNKDDNRFAPWSGTWTTMWGDTKISLTLKQSGPFIKGTYDWDGGKIKGQLKVSEAENILSGTWSQNRNKGWFEFSMNGDGNSFEGTWGYGSGGKQEGTWSGTRD